MYHSAVVRHASVLRLVQDTIDRFPKPTGILLDELKQSSENEEGGLRATCFTDVTS